MKVVPFIAENAATALSRIHEQLGPEALVLSMRQLPRQGLARFWHKSSSVEVLACVAEAGDQRPSNSDQPSDLASKTLIGASRHFNNLPALYGDSDRPHVFIGPPGCGKTTLLCKWMARTILHENRRARAWRLDGVSANTAEFLTVYGEMLGVPVQRCWNVRTSVCTPSNEQFAPDLDLLLIDLPGVQPNDPQAVRGLQTALGSLPNPRVHLVLNAAYDVDILREQYHAFASFNPEDLSLSHLDEERRETKLLEVISGTNCSLRFLSTGQKVPGDFVVAGEEPGTGRN